MLKRLLGNRKGVSMVEFAIVFPLLLAFIGGTVDFGMAFFASHIAQNAAREGARLAVTQENLPGGAFNLQVVNQRIEDALPAINLFQDYTYTTNMNFQTCQVTVTVTGTSPVFFLPAAFVSTPEADGSIFGKEFAIQRSVAMRYERDRDNNCPS